MKHYWIPKRSTALVPLLFLSLTLLPAMAGDQEALVKQYFALWNSGEVAAADRLLHTDFVRHTMPRDSKLAGIQAFKDDLTRVLDGSKGMKIQVVEVVTSGDRSTVRWVMEGTQSSSNRSFKVPGISLLRSADGKLIEELAYWDNLSLYNQMGFRLSPPKK